MVLKFPAIKIAVSICCLLFFSNFSSAQVLLDNDSSYEVNTIKREATWVNNDGAFTYENEGTRYDLRALLHSKNSFKSDTGFKLTIEYTTDIIENSAAHNFSFGLISDQTNLSTYDGFNPFAADSTVYSIGANLTADKGTNLRGINFTNTEAVENLDQSGTRAQFLTGESTKLTLEIGIGGYWSYRINDVYEASGAVPDGFDLTKKYHVAIYGQDDHGGQKSIQSIKLEKRVKLGERAASIRGTWTLPSARYDLDSFKDFKTLDGVTVSFNSGATQSASHNVPLKVFDMLWDGDTGSDGEPINQIAPEWGNLNANTPDQDPFLDQILEIKAAGFKIKGYTNSENFVGDNADEYVVFVDRWKAYCDKNYSDFMNSQPYHTGIWNANTQQYEDASATYPDRKYMFCYAEYVLKEYALRYGSYFSSWIFDSGGSMEDHGDDATSMILEDQRIYQAFANAVHAGNPDTPIAFNNSRSTISYDSYPYAKSLYFEDFTFGHAFGGNNSHATKSVNDNGDDSGTFYFNEKHVTRMTATDGYVHDGGDSSFDDLIVGNFHSKLATTSWSSGSVQAWEQDDFNEWNLEAMLAGGSMTWGGSVETKDGETQIRPWAYNLLKNMDEYLAKHESPGNPNWSRVNTILPDAVLGEEYNYELVEGEDFWDPEGDDIIAVWAYNEQPSWLTVKEDDTNPGHWVLSGTPTENEATEYSFKMRAKDDNDNNGTKNVELSVKANNTAPIWSSDSVLSTAYTEQLYYHEFIMDEDFRDIEADDIVLFTTSAEGIDKTPSWLTVEQDKNDSKVWIIGGLVTDTEATTYDFRFRIRDDAGNAVSKMFTLTIESKNHKFLQFNPDTDAVYEIEAINGYMLAALGSGTHIPPYSVENSYTDEEDLVWQFEEHNSGLWHIQTAQSGNARRLRSDNVSEAVMRKANTIGTWAQFEIIPAQNPYKGFYNIILSNHSVTEFSKLSVTRDGVFMVANDGTQDSSTLFTLSEVDNPIESDLIEITTVAFLSAKTEIYNTSVYPNPTSGDINLALGSNFNEGENISIKIFDLTGKLIYQTKNTLATNNYTLNLREVGANLSGTYIVTINSLSTSEYRKIILE